MLLTHSVPTQVEAIPGLKLALDHAKQDFVTTNDRAAWQDVVRKLLAEVRGLQDRVHADFLYRQVISHLEQEVQQASRRPARLDGVQVTTVSNSRILSASELSTEQWQEELDHALMLLALYERGGGPVPGYRMIYSAAQAVEAYRVQRQHALTDLVRGAAASLPEV
jgi:hypothetical protein